MSVPSSYKPSDYVFWRYTVGTEAWQSWDDTATLTFTEPETTVYVEAWMYCGRALQESFKVVLHPHSTYNACAAFSSLWTEVAPSPRTVESHMCAYPESNFVVMKFDYDSESGMTHDANTVQGKYTDVKCYVKLAESGALDAVTEGEMVLTWTPGANGRIQVSKQLALDLVQDPETAEDTDVKVWCDFTFTHFDAATTETESCPHSFTITDCDQPAVEAYGAEEVCKAGECLSLSGTSGPFEACGGSVLTTVSDATQAKSLSGDCCDECSTTLTCAALPESSATEGVKRCQPAPTGEVVLTVLQGSSNEEGATPTSLTVMSLVGAGAVVAFVALVLAKHRRALPVREFDDAYSPLLD